MYKIKDTCAGCHACEMACPVCAIDYDGPFYQINPELCVECGLCETLCPTCSIYDTEAVKVLTPHDPIVKECDLVVCGGGTGLISAIKAAQMGKKVILLEKAKRVGGNTDIAHAFFPVYSKLHAERGIADVREAAVKDLFAMANGVISEDIMRTAVYGCTDFFNWLLDFPDARKCFSLERPEEKRNVGPIYGPAVIGFPKKIQNKLSKDPSIGPGWMGTFIIKAMLNAIPQQKLDVEVLLEHRAKHLITDESGRICGVIAQDSGGETHIKTKAVILATGGFGRSDEKLQKYSGFFDVDRNVTRFSVPTDTGDGIDMLLELGVEPVEERLFVSLFGPAHHPYSYSLYRLIEEPVTLSVDLNAKRWQDETGGLQTGRINIAGHPKEVAWAIYTQKNIDKVMRDYVQNPALSHEFDCYENYQKDLDREAALPKPPVYKAGTIEELALKIGIDPDVLADTVKRYNYFCKTGVDEEFGKSKEHLVPLLKGPYYGIWGQRFSECAMGGLMVNGMCEVLRNDGTPIPGLYGVGDATSAMHRKDHLAVVSELTWAVASAYSSSLNAVSAMNTTNTAAAVPAASADNETGVNA